MSEVSGPRPTASEGSVPHAVPTELLRALAHLCEPPGPAHAALADALGLPEPPDAAGHEELFGFQLYPRASVHLGAEGMIGGEAERRIEGFWRAVGREPPAEPDHLASLLGLYVALAEEESELRGEEDRGPGALYGATARATLVARSRRALLEEHLAPWVFAFLERVRDIGGRFHTAWAELLGRVLEAELEAGGPLDRVPAVLEDFPSLADPRSEGAGPFLGGLLAPAVSGLILTRADLARIASGRELGLRAGERRYALEHLLGQEASAVLLALANEADRQAAAHRTRADRLGTGTGWSADRSAATGDLLRTLAESADELLVATPSPGNS